MEVGLEFHSLSKSYNMTGWRVGMAVGNSEMIDALMVVKSNLDSGIPNAVQYMGIEAMNITEEEIDEREWIKTPPAERQAGLHLAHVQAGI